MEMLPFHPDNAAFSGHTSSTISATQTASTALQIKGTSEGAKTAMISSEPGSATAFIRFGDSNVASSTTTNDTPILGGSVQPFLITGETYISAICATGKTATLYVTMGMGD